MAKTKAEATKAMAGRDDLDKRLSKLEASAKNITASAKDELEAAEVFKNRTDHLLDALNKMKEKVLVYFFWTGDLSMTQLVSFTSSLSDVHDDNVEKTQLIVISFRHIDFLSS